MQVQMTMTVILQVFGFKFLRSEDYMVRVLVFLNMMTSIVKVSVEQRFSPEKNNRCHFAYQSNR